MARCYNIYLVVSHSNKANIVFHVHRVARRDSPSGFGFELTFRLKKQAGETSPPSWPAELLQSLARYVFQTGVYITVIIYYFYDCDGLIVNHFPFDDRKHATKW